MDRALGRLSAKWSLLHYPWAGAISTAHTVLYYARGGRRVFRELAKDARRVLPFGYRAREVTARFDLGMAARAEQREKDVWQKLAFEKRTVTREAYAALTGDAPELVPSPGFVRCAAGEAPARVAKGRRPNHAPSAAG